MDADGLILFAVIVSAIDAPVRLQLLERLHLTGLLHDPGTYTATPPQFIDATPLGL